MSTEFARSQTIGLSCEGHDAGMLSEYTPKPSNIAELKTALVSKWNDLPQKFIDKAISSFRKRLRSCFAAAGGHFKHSLNTEGVAEIRHWNVGTVDEKVVQSLIRYFWIFRTRDCMFTWKSELQYLNCSLFYLLNHMCYCNKIYRICGLNHHL